MRSDALIWFGSRISSTLDGFFSAQPISDHDRISAASKVLRVTGVLPSAAAAIELNTLQSREIDSFEAPDVHGRRGRARRADAEPERRCAATGAEVVLYDVLVERVRPEHTLGRREPEVLARHEPQQVALAAAMGAIALHDLLQVPFDLEGDAAAVAATLVRHAVVDGYSSFRWVFLTRFFHFSMSAWKNFVKLA